MEINSNMNNQLIQIGVIISIFLATIIVAYFVNRFFLRLIRKSTDVDDKDATNYHFLRHISRAIIYTVGFGITIYHIPQLRTLANSMLAGAGILAVAIGFASQHALGNIVSGIFIVIFKPFKINDRLNIRNMVGIVEDITLRHTVIRDFENKRILIPNTVISDEIIVNSDFAEDKICKWIDVNISYDSDTDLAKSLMADEVKNHPMYVDPRTPEQIQEGVPEVVVRVLVLGEYFVTVRAWAWAKDAPNSFVMACDLLESIKKRFEKEGVEIPVPHQKIIFKEQISKT
jgi:small-conductance mechanosensitive channel